jgi:integrase
MRKELRYLVQSLKLNPKITPHSFRAGGASTAYDNGISEATVMKHGRWKSNKVFRNHYLHLSEDQKKKATCF